MLGSRHGLKLSAGLVFGLFLGLAAGPAQAAADDAKLGNIPGKPGTIIGVSPIAGVGPGSKAFRVVYRSTGLQGEPIAVSGAFFIPTGAAPAAAGT
jgi:hypothetical protein